MPALLTIEEQLMVREATERLQRKFAGQFNTETIDRFVTDSVAQLGLRAKTTAWIPVLAERFASDRLRALLRLESSVGVNPAVLFLCVHNAGRSQMAAGFMRHLSGGQIEVFSGGSEPAESINEVVVQAMAEKGIDISTEIPQPWADEIVRAADVVVTMGCGDACPVFPGKRYLDWELDDPSGQSIEQVLPIRDEIESRVRHLLSELLPGAQVAPTSTGRTDLSDFDKEMMSTSSTIDWWRDKPCIGSRFLLCRPARSLRLFAGSRPSVAPGAADNRMRSPGPSW